MISNFILANGNLYYVDINYSSQRNTIWPANELNKSKKDDSGQQTHQLLNIPNKELTYRSTKPRLKGPRRIFSYYNAPIIKFFNHFVVIYLFESKWSNKIESFCFYFKIHYILFLMVYTGFLLFDYHPEKESKSTVIRIPVKNKPIFIKVTITELLLIIFVFIYQLDQIREVKNDSKIHNFYFAFNLLFIQVFANSIGNKNFKANKKILQKQQLEHIQFDIVFNVLSYTLDTIFAFDCRTCFFHLFRKLIWSRSVSLNLNFLI